MAENKKSFLLYCDLIHTVEKLPKTKAGELFMHILKYVNDENPKTNDILVEVSFEPIKQQLKRDLVKWEEIRIKRSDAGKSSANKRKQKQQMLTSVESVEQTSTNPTVTVNDTVTVNVNDTLLKETFEGFRKLYPGTRKGLETEYENLKKKHKDYKKIIPKLEALLNNQIAARKIIKANNGFLPQWKMLQTYINQRSWEEEIAIDEVQQSSKKGQKLTYNEVLDIQLKGVFPDPPDPDIMSKLNTIKEGDKTYWVYK